MRGVNRLILVGRVGRDPELKQGRSGIAWCSLSIATDRSVKEDQGWSTTTDWHRVRAFGRTAENCHQRLTRGSLVAVEGPVTYETWRDDSGATRTAAVVLADRVEFLAPPAARPEPPAQVVVGSGAQVGAQA